jgi:hypothetical protein
MKHSLVKARIEQHTNSIAQALHIDVNEIPRQIDSEHYQMELLSLIDSAVGSLQHSQPTVGEVLAQIEAIDGIGVATMNRIRDGLDVI